MRSIKLLNVIKYFFITFTIIVFYNFTVHLKSVTHKDTKGQRQNPSSYVGSYENHGLKIEEKNPHMPLSFNDAILQIKYKNSKLLNGKHISKVMLVKSAHGNKSECEDAFELKKLVQENETYYDDVIIERHPNLPKFLTQSRWISSSIPEIQRIRWTGTVYQESWKDSPKLLLYSAHFDSRFNSSLFIHTLAFYDGDEERDDLNSRKYFCKIWFDITDNPIAVPVYDSIRISIRKYNDSRLHPFVLSCKVLISENSTDEFPIAVSLVSHQCQVPVSVLKISASPVKKMKQLNKNLTVGICGKALYYYNKDFSTRLIEWIEILKVLGASKIFLYKLNCHKNVQKVLDFYEKEGMVKVITFYYPPPIIQEGTFIRLWAKTVKKEYRSVQNMYLNDCLLRNKDDFDYLGVFDSDEIPIMKKHQSLPELFRFLRQGNKEPESYFFRHKLFFRDLKSKLQPSNEMDRSYSFSHNIRTKLSSVEVKYFETDGKTFYDTNQVAWATPHKNIPASSSISPEVKLTGLPRELAYMGHFTEDHKCTVKEYCIDGNMEEETALFPIRDKILQEMNKVLNVLKIY